MANIPSGRRFIVAAAGDLACVLAKHRKENRLVPRLTFTGTTGVQYTVDVSTPDVVCLYGSLKVMFAADADQVSRWWQRVSADERSGTAAPAAAEMQES
jgi:hypothetical protein